MFGFEFLILFLIVLFLLYKWSTRNFSTFKKRGIPHEKPLPVFGNSWSFVSNRGSLHKFMLKLYNIGKQHKVYGFYNFGNPIFIINDPELIKQIGVKDFDAFANHQQIFNIQKDPIFGSMLTTMRDQRWKDMRNTVSPIYTGAKMRAMFTLMNDCFLEIMKYLKAQLNNDDCFDIELKDCFSRLSNDLIATTAFGLKINSYENKENEFYTIGQCFSKSSGRRVVAFILFSLSPKLCSFLGIKPFDSKITDYFVHLVVDAMKYREEHNIIRPDMIQLLMEAKKESEHRWSEEELVAQCFIFFFAAFENNANLLGFTCHELMENPDVQKKLYEEILEANERLEGKTVDYDTLQNMKYLDMVLTETLRKWSLAPIINRECGRDYTVRDDEGKIVCQLKQGDAIWFQAIGLHWDPEYFDEPEMYQPERFSEDNKKHIKPFTYIPFGVGPRICIGSRYALIQAKAVLFYLLKDFSFERSEKSSANLLNDMRALQTTPKNGFWLKLRLRHEK